MEYKSGDICEVSGEYVLKNRDGKMLKKVFVSFGELMPETDEEGAYYEFSN